MSISRQWKGKDGSRGMIDNGWLFGIIGFDAYGKFRIELHRCRDGAEHYYEFDCRPGSPFFAQLYASVEGHP